MHTGNLQLIDILSGCDVTFKICKETVKNSVLSLCFACRYELLKIDWVQIAYFCYCLGITVVRGDQVDNDFRFHCVFSSSSLT